MKNFILKINRALAGKKKLFFFLLAAGMMLTSCGDSNEPAFDNIGTLKGKFTVDDKGTQVQFSRGNLQYQASTKTWRFAEYQWEVCGKEANEALSPTNSGWIDLFGWGSGDFPFLSSREYNDYSVFTDWSKKAISNGGKKENLWHTLEIEEWKYLFYGRTDAAQLFSMGSVNGINGLILLPDNWEGERFNDVGKGLRDKGEYYEGYNRKTYSLHTYTADEWKTMEDKGAVFLPAAGYRDGKEVSKLETYGFYWSATRRSNIYAYNFKFTDERLTPKDYGHMYFGLAVRPVR